MGHVNNTVHFRYMEQTRIEWLYACAQRLGVGAYGGQGPVIVNASCTFHAPLTYPGEAEVRMFVGPPGKSSVESYYEIWMGWKEACRRRGEAGLDRYEDGEIGAAAGTAARAAEEPLSESHMSRVSGAMASDARRHLPTAGAANSSFYSQAAQQRRWGHCAETRRDGADLPTARAICRRAVRPWRPAMGFAPLRAAHPGKPPSRPRGTRPEAPYAPAGA
jgi:hypothetical protein